MENLNMKNVLSMTISILAGVALIFLTTVLPASASSNPNLGVVPVDETLQDNRTYSKLTGDWWNWLSQFPFATSPNFEDGTIDCSRGQSGKIWFLAGNFGGSNVRSCTIPKSKALFFPILNSLFWTPEDGETATEVRKFVNFFMNGVATLEVSVDGVPLTDLFAYRAQSVAGGFIWEGVIQKDFGLEQFPRLSVTDGFWILLEPLSEGNHIIHIKGTAPIPPDDLFELDILYNITIDGNMDDDNEQGMDDDDEQ